MATATINGVVTELNAPDEYGNVYFTFDGVSGSTYSITVANFKTYSGYLEVNTEASGRTGEFDFSSVGGFEFPFNTEITVNGSATFTATETASHEIAFRNGAALVSFDLISSAATIDSLIDDALASVKTYIDSKDVALKSYADSLIDSLMQTTDLSAKLALLNEINAILDGDTATAGFQLWESNVAKLTKVITDLQAESAARASAITATNSTLTAMVSTAESTLNARIDAIDSGLTGSISTNVATLNSNVTANFVAMKAKAAILFAV
jgi:hypothetical protein